MQSFAEETKRLMIKGITSKKVYTGTPFGPVNSSGRLAASVEIKQTESGFQIWANDYILGLIHGVKPSESKATVSNISTWIEEKPIISNIPKETLAGMIVKAQQKKGNMIWRIYQGANSGLITEALDDERFNSFVDLLASKAVENLTDKIIESFEIDLS